MTLNGTKEGHNNESLTQSLFADGRRKLAASSGDESTPYDPGSPESVEESLTSDSACSVFAASSCKTGEPFSALFPCYDKAFPASHLVRTLDAASPVQGQPGHAVRATKCFKWWPVKPPRR